ncbi:MAG: M16 family metallopeptidase [Leptothrix ochracea]|uniref:M16 family metallopeptidase n=1 Tax=Leptothrix ochracea TaxID=735331 RepID=UPI0034E21E26
MKRYKAAPSRWLIAVPSMALAVLTSVPIQAETANKPTMAALLGQSSEQALGVEGIREFRLANGLQVLLAPDDAKPTVTVNLTYRVGSRHENYGETGMAHLLEHLIFKGTPKTPNAFAEFNKRGFRANGSTWLDRTNYFASFAYNEDHLRWFLGWHADAMVHSFIAKRDLDTEMTVVRNEMERGENDPQSILMGKTLASMYQWHNYGKDTIGARADVENVDIGRLQAFYRTWYQPDNATLIVTGKFDEAKVRRWIETEFGRIPKPKRALPRFYTLDPVQDGERSVTLRRVGGTPMLFSAYHVPPGPHPDTAAIEMLGLILGDTPGGRLHKRLVEAKLAASIFAWNAALADPGFALYGVQIAPGGDVDKARTALLATLESIETEPITIQELERARSRWLKDWDMQFNDPERVGVALSESVAQGDWRLFFLLRDRVRSVTLTDVERVAMERFQASNRTLATYLPTDKPKRAPAPKRVDLAAEMSTFVAGPALAKGEAFDPDPALIDKRVQRSSLAGGLKLALLPKSSRGQSVNAQWVLHFGDAESLKGQRSVGTLLAALLDRGTRTLSRQQISDLFDALKAEVSIHGGPDGLVVRMHTQRRYLPDLIDLVGQMLREPALSQTALDELRSQLLADLASQRQEPEALAENALQRHGNPYPRGDIRHARSFDEIEADLRSVTVEQLQAFHQRFVSARHAEFAAVGDFDTTAVKTALGLAIQPLAAEAPYTRVPTPLVKVPATKLTLALPDKQSATLLVRQAVELSDADVDYPALMMANWLLGGPGGDSRLWLRIREKEGLSYDVRSQIQWSNVEPHSIWSASVSFAPQNAVRVETAFREEVARAFKDGFTAKELASGQQSLLSFRKLSRAQDGALAAAMVSQLELGRTFEQTRKVDEAIAGLSLDQVNAALRRYLHPDDFVMAWAGDLKP